jgi:hypothetical protein
VPHRHFFDESNIDAFLKRIVKEWLYLCLVLPGEEHRIESNTLKAGVNGHIDTREYLFKIASA